MKKPFSIGFIGLNLLIVSFGLCAQDQNPPSIKWAQIETPHFKIVVPENILLRGIETANNLEAAYLPDGKSLGIHTKKIPVFLFNQPVISNGYTTLIPRHIGYYTTPPQDAFLVGGSDWLQILTIHEFRHAVQFQKLDTNLTHYVGTLAGNIGKTLCMYVSVPLWVFEGDAVCNETIYTGEGRGRLPSFTRDIRALETEGIRYSYYKAYQGSFRNYFPDYYHLGYLMTAHLRKNYGAETWNNILNYSTKISCFPFIFSASLRRNTHFSTLSTYRNCLDEFDRFWFSKSYSPAFSEPEKISPENPKAYTNYSYPVWVGPDQVIALKQGFDNPPTLVLLENGKEKKLIEISPIDRIHSNGKYVVWSSESADLRWGQRTFADILVYQIGSKSFKYLTHKGKYFAPAISPDSKKIAAIEYGEDMRCSLVIFNAASGKKESRFVFSDTLFARMPSWSADGKRIVLTLTSGQKRNISIFYPDSNVLKQLTPYSTESITNPVFYGKYILFNSPVTGVDAIHAINTETLERYVIGESKYGVYNPSVSPDGAYLSFQNYTIGGYEIAAQPIDERQWNRLEDIKIKQDDYYKYLIEQENAVNIFDSLNLSNRQGYIVKKYQPLMHFLNVHSWYPYPVHNGVGLSILSNDILNTTSVKAGANYFTEDEAHREFLDISFARYFPVFDLGFSYGRNYDYFRDLTDTMRLYKLNEKVLTADVSFPLNFSHGIYTTLLTLGAGYKYIYTRFLALDSTCDVSALELSLKFVRSKQLTHRDLNPRFGQEINLTYWESLSNSGLQGNRLVADATFYLPGVAVHHSTTLKAGYQQSSPVFREGVYKLTTDLEYIRGYKSAPADRIIKGTFEYTLPLGYPDMALGSVFYLKRINANLFYDNGLVEFKNNQELYSSLGMDLNFEFNLFSIPAILWEVGVRYSYRLKDQGNTVEILFFGIPLN